MPTSEALIDIFIDISAQRLLKQRWGRRFLPRHHPRPSIRSVADGYNRLVLIWERWCDVGRLIRLRAVRLKRLFDSADPLGRTDPRPAALSPVILFFLSLRPCAALAPAIPAPHIRAPP